jgi:hypothetical protein
VGVEVWVCTCEREVETMELSACSCEYGIRAYRCEVVIMSLEELRAERII